ncbi:MAG: glycosyltransferase family 2 protein [Rhizobiaceae bacterium]
MISTAATVCVMIAAKDASATISRAIGSALKDEMVAEVVVVDDGSSDDTSGKAMAQDDGTGRLRVLKLERNRGPAFARNYAIAHSTAPFLAILDADDFFLKGRFGRLFQHGEWDLIADNIVFVDGQDEHSEPDVRSFEAAPRMLGLAEFILGNISKRGARRGELGFLKPVIRRDFLERAALRYNEEMRLGEDYELYVRALAKGARYKIIHDCGYAAVIRPDSLSGQHRTEDLRRLFEADHALKGLPDLTEDARNALRQHERNVASRHALRRFLDVKKANGIGRAGFHALRNPSALPAIVGGIAADKIEAFTRRGAPHAVGPIPRYLLQGQTAD